MPEAAEVSRLVQQVSHELRTPLTAILLEVDVLEGFDPPSAARQSLASVRRAARRLNEVADQVCQLIDRSRSDPPGPGRPLIRDEQPAGRTGDGRIEVDVCTAQRDCPHSSL